MRESPKLNDVMLLFIMPTNLAISLTERTIEQECLRSHRGFTLDLFSVNRHSAKDKTNVLLDRKDTTALLRRSEFVSAAVTLVLRTQLSLTVSEEKKKKKIKMEENAISFLGNFYLKVKKSSYRHRKVRNAGYIRAIRDNKQNRIWESDQK